jgi:type II secretory pathway pseudopilin PulG
MKMLCHNNEKGYTLSELLIAVVISMILVAAATATYIAQNRSYVAQESVSEVNTQSKVAHDLIANNIKTAGFGTPDDMNVDIINNRTTTVIPYESNGNNPDALTIIGGFRVIGTLWPDDKVMGTAYPCPADGSAVPLETTSVHIEYSGDERPNDDDKQYLSIDGVQFVRVSSCTLNGLDCDNSGKITLDRPLTVDYPLLNPDGDGDCDSGRPVYLVEDVTYCVDGNNSMQRMRRRATASTCTPAGTSDVDEIAENIEDLQFAYAIDADNDNLIDDTDASGSVNAGDFSIGTAIADVSQITAIRTNVLARAEHPDPDYAGMGNLPDFVENRDHDETATDNFRRRWWQSIISMRGE